jgi:hypothetical protein
LFIAISRGSQTFWTLGIAMLFVGKRRLDPFVIFDRKAFLAESKKYG